jgi:hypothetical protein
VERAARSSCAKLTSVLSAPGFTVGPVTRIGTFEFAAPLWQYPGADGWHFVSLPGEISDDITDITVGIRRGFGSVRVAVTVGRTAWRTSIFPDRKTGTYMLPVKKAVRTAEHLLTGADVEAQLEIVDL